MILDRYDPIGARMYDGISKARPDWYQNFEAAQQSFMRVDSTMSRRFGLEGVWSDITSRLNEELGDRYMRLGSATAGSFPDPTRYFGTSDAMGSGDARYTYEATRVIDQVLQLELDNPGTVPEDILSLMNMQAIEDRMREEAMASRENLMQITEQSRGTGGFARFMGSLSGGMYEFSQDPLQTVTMFYGNSRQLWRFAAQQAALNASIEVMRQPQVAQWYGELGLEYTAEQFYRNVSIAGVAGAGFAVGFRGAVAGAGVAGRELGPAVDRLRVGRDVATFTRALDEAQPNMLEALSIQQLRSGIEAMESAGVRIGSEARAAIELASAIDENASLNPGLPAAQHAELLDIAILDVANGRIPEDLIYRAPEALPAEVFARGQPEMDNLGGVIYAFDPRDIGVDARTFQFKGGGDEFGVTDRLQFITEWDPQLAGVVTVYEYADGRLFIADGHQRVALAKRLMSQNPDLNIQLYGYRLREVDGVTPEQAMISAAVTNIAQGTGSIIDAAKIARMDPERFRSMVGRTLPPTSQLVRQAQDMMALSQDAFGAVINEVIPSNYGAIVGRILGDRPELQQAAISVLARAEPANVFQAEAIVRQVREADVDVATQQSLFGEEMVVESLYTERARVLDRAVKTLRQDRAAFANLVRNAENIESAGNVLDRSVNQRRADLDGQAIALVQTLANRKGPLSDALSDAARLARDTGSYGASTRQFVESIRRAIADGDFERLTSGEVGRAVNDTPPSSRSEVGKEPSLTGFDEPTGHGPAAEQQVGNLEREMFPEPEPAPAVEVGSIDELRALVQANADRAQLDQHPTVVRALEEMDARPETIDLPGYASNEWHSSRIYTIDGQEIAGTAAALREWEIQAEQLAWVEKGIEPQPVARDREATIILGPPAAGKSTIANDIAIARKAAIIDSDEIKKSIPGFDRGVGAKAVHEESSTLGKILTARMLDSGTNVIIPKVGDSVASILKQVDLLKESGYSVRIVNMAVSPDNAYRRMIGRFASTGRIIPPSYLDYVGAKPSAVYQELKARGVADGYAEIDNNGAFGAPKPTTEIIGQNPLEGSPFGLAQRGPEIDRAPDGVGAEPGRAVAAGVSPVTVTAEFTQAGEQMVIPGAERISDRELAERQAAEAMRGGQAALPEGGLFDETARAQQDLFADVNLDEEIPVSAIVDPQTGEIVPQTMTMRDLKQMLDEEDSFMDRLGYCTR
jgi:predicted kinase